MYVCLLCRKLCLVISSDTVIVRAGGAIWLNPFATVLFSVCSSACGPSELLDTPSICFVCVFVCQKLSSHLGV